MTAPPDSRINSTRTGSIVRMKVTGARSRLRSRSRTARSLSAADFLNLCVKRIRKSAKLFRCFSALSSVSAILRLQVRLRSCGCARSAVSRLPDIPGLSSVPSKVSAKRRSGSSTRISLCTTPAFCAVAPASADSSRRATTNLMIPRIPHDQKSVLTVTSNCCSSSAWFQISAPCEKFRRSGPKGDAQNSEAPDHMTVT